MGSVGCMEKNFLALKTGERAILVLLLSSIAAVGFAQTEGPRCHNRDLKISLLPVFDFLSYDFDVRRTLFISVGKVISILEKSGIHLVTSSRNGSAGKILVRDDGAWKNRPEYAYFASGIFNLRNHLLTVFPMIPLSYKHSESKLDSCKHAIQGFSLAIETRKDFSEAYYYRAFSYFLLGKIESAILDMTRYLHSEKESTSGRFSRSYLYYEAGNFEFSLIDLKGCAQSYPLSDEVSGLVLILRLDKKLAERILAKSDLPNQPATSPAPDSP